MSKSKNPAALGQDAEKLVVSTSPDVCLTPQGSSMVSVPYRIMASLADVQNTSPNVRFNGKPAVLFDASFIPHTQGAEAGVGGGIHSGTTGAAAWPIGHCQSIIINGKYLVREGDAWEMNGSPSANPPANSAQALGAFVSDYAPQQLIQLAQTSTPLGFIISLLPYFGCDIPPKNYEQLYELAKHGKPPRPVFHTCNTHNIRYNTTQQEIRIPQDLAKRAVAGDPEAQGDFFAGLLHAYGDCLFHHLAHVWMDPEYPRHVGTRGKVADYELSLDDLWSNTSLTLGIYQGPQGGPVHLTDHFLRKNLAALNKELSEHASEFMSSASEARAEHPAMFSTQGIEAENSNIAHMMRMLRASHAEHASMDMADGMLPHPDFWRDTPACHSIKHILRCSLGDPQADGTFQPVYDAPLTPGRQMEGRYNHMSIEIEALTVPEGPFLPQEVRNIYYGNFLRDFSQLKSTPLKGADGRQSRCLILYYTHTMFKFFMQDAANECDKLLKRGTLSSERHQYALDLGKKIMQDFIQVTHLMELQGNMLKPMRELNPKALDAYLERVGQASEVEHIDNPNTPPQTEEVHEGRLMHRYMLPSIDHYMVQQLKLAASEPNAYQARMHFGNALHVLEDFFAHSNFTEVLLRQTAFKPQAAGHARNQAPGEVFFAPHVIAWTKALPVGGHSLHERIPLITGTFDDRDKLFSILLKANEILHPTTNRHPHIYSNLLLQILWMSLIESMVHQSLLWRVLQGLGVALPSGSLFRNLFRLHGLSSLKQSIAAAQASSNTPVQSGIHLREPDAPSEALHDEISSHTQHYMAKLNALMGGLVREIVLQPTLNCFDFKQYSLPPTHSMIAKDDSHHPLHVISCKFAVHAVRSVGWSMHNVWNAKDPVEKARVLEVLLSTAKNLCVHPNHLNDSNRAAFNSIAQDWFNQTPQAKHLLNRASDPEHMRAMAREHYGHFVRGMVPNFCKTFPPKPSLDPLAPFGGQDIGSIIQNMVHLTDDDMLDMVHAEFDQMKHTEEQPSYLRDNPNYQIQLDYIEAYLSDNPPETSAERNVWI